MCREAGAAVPRSGRSGATAVQLVSDLEDAAAYPPVYDLSERRTEAFVNDSLLAKYFLGLAVDEAAPDHSTLTAFKRRIVKRGKESLFEELLTEVVQSAQPGRGGWMTTCPIPRSRWISCFGN